jgi:hypothetical protein
MVGSSWVEDAVFGRSVDEDVYEEEDGGDMLG